MAISFIIDSSESNAVSDNQPFATEKDLDATLRLIAAGAPCGGAYTKTRVSIAIDGETVYTARMDIQGDSDEAANTSIRAHLARSRDFYRSEKGLDWMTKCNADAVGAAAAIDEIIAEMDAPPAPTGADGIVDGKDLPVTYTHDGRPVHPAGADLPDGASGWTLCHLRPASYSTWLDREDQPRARADMAEIRKMTAKIRTRKQADRALRAAALPVGGLVRDARVDLEIALYARRWPLRAA